MHWCTVGGLADPHGAKVEKPVSKTLFPSVTERKWCAGHCRPCSTLWEHNRGNGSSRASTGQWPMGVPPSPVLGQHDL